jgi:tRNA threonylcarbamoyladenosine biosynthesis protein TsaE
MSPILDAKSIDIISHNEAQTRRLGARLGHLFHGGEVVALFGDLGTGKTRWVQGIGSGLGISENITSPSFTLINVYRGRLKMVHVDLYRINKPEEALAFGLEEYLYGDDVVVIEWAERAQALLPPEYLEVQLHHMRETKRGLTLRPHGQAYENLLAEFKKQAFGYLGGSR